MFLVEIVAGLAAGSASLQADALDFLTDAGNYGISPLVVGMALRYRAGAALAANAAAFGMLWAYRGGDSNMRSVWLCSRNDVIGNVAVLLPAAGVFGTGTGWPDVIVVAAVMAVLALQGAVLVIRQAPAELRDRRAASVPAERAEKVPCGKRPGTRSAAGARRAKRNTASC